MKLIDSVGIRGGLSAYIVDPKWTTKFPTRLPKNEWPVIEEVFKTRNTLMDLGRLKANKTGLNFNYIAGGSINTDTVTTDLVLGNEVQRFEVTDVIYQLGEINVFAEIDPGTGNLTWQEWGLFMDDAVITRNSGTMFSRIVQEYHKVLGNTVLLNYTYTETV